MRKVLARSLRVSGMVALVGSSLVVTGDRTVAQEGGTVGPDVTVIYLQSVSHYEDVAEPGLHAYSVGTTSCNVGDEPLWWCDDVGPNECDADNNGQPDVGPEMHPVIGQNLYRLQAGRFEQIGMSWLKHGFLSVNSNDPNCGTCQQPPAGGDQLGVGCTDPYGSGLNGSRPLGLRSEVNSTTGEFPFPYTNVNWSTAIDQRIRVEEADLDPAQNPGAKYWVEGHYVAPDDAERGNALNNASYREVTVQQPSYGLSLVGGTIREQAAINAWKSEDPSVQIINVDIPETRPVERFHAARTVSTTDFPAGIVHYEYVIHNLNSDRSARSFRIEFPGPVTISDVGFHDVDHHSGEPYATTDWDITIDEAAGTLEFSTDTFAADPNANALRWGTMFTFWFDADLPPNDLVHTLGLFKPGSPGSVSMGFVDTVFIFGDNFESGDTSMWTATN